MVKPRALSPGDRVAVVAPASPFARDEFEAGVSELRRLGFEPVYDARVFARRGYVAGEPAVRAAAIDDAWRDASIGGLIGARGGYGSAQVLPLLDAEMARRSRKPFVGYSDLTAILSFLTTRCGLVAFHGPMLAGRLGRGIEGYDSPSFLEALCRREPMGELSPPGLESLVPGESRGRLFGGTLTQLVASLGTPFAFAPPDDYVLLIDEVGERPYRLDRMITQLRQANLLRRARAIAIGELPKCEEVGGEPTARAVVADVLSDFPGPVVFGLPTGHSVGAALTLPLGVSCRVIAGSTSKIVIEEPAVE
jgi:muramoyltetrapeptide carboxypeptidase